MFVLPHVGQQFEVMNGYASVLPEHDFETYSEAGYEWNEAEQKWEGVAYAPTTKRGLNVVGIYNYVLHPSFRLLELAYNLKNGDGARIWRPGFDDPADLFDWVKRYRHNQSLESTDGILEAWNVFFEVSVWNLYCVPKLGWPPLFLDQVRCCMAKAALAGYPRKLENTAKVLKLVNQKDTQGGKLVSKLTVPRNPTKKNPQKFWTPETAPEDFTRFYAYNVQDIMAESEASLRIPDMPPEEIIRWQVDQRINHRGMQIDMVAVGNCLAVIDQAAAKYNAELQQITNGQVKAFSEVTKTVGWLQTQGVYLDGLDENVVEEELLKNHVHAVKRVLQIRRSLSFGSVKKLNGMWLQTCADGRLRDMFAFASNHTHHWAGVGPQVMNLYKADKFNKPEQVEFALGVLASRSLEYVEKVFANGPPWDTDDNKPMEALDVIANCLRSMIVARPGTRLMMADYNAIQAVITAALAGEKWQLDVFHRGGQIYLETASTLTGKPVQFYVDYRKDNGKHHPDRQLYGKIPTLANGFGAYVGGWRRFDDEGILGTDEEVKKLIFLTWAKNPNICELWGGQTRNKFGRNRLGQRANEYPECYGLEGAAVRAVQNPGTAFGYRGIRYQVHKDVLYCMPPGGGAPLVYHEPHLEKATREHSRPWEFNLSYVGWNTSQTKGRGGWERMDLYGGIATQNIVAKVHREFQADTLVALEQTQVYLPVHHGHDENVVEVENGKGSIDEYLSIVNRGKSWAVDDWGRPWPVKAPGAEEVQRYGKFE
jgi:DNA polymerase bacteriophage-type